MATDTEDFGPGDYAPSTSWRPPGLRALGAPDAPTTQVHVDRRWVRARARDLPAVRARLRAQAPALPFLAVVVAAWGLATTQHRVDAGAYIAATATGVVALGLMLVPRPRGRIGRMLGDLPAALLILAAIGLLRVSVQGGPVSVYCVVALIPVFWTALYGDSLAQLAVMLVAFLAFFAAPPAIIGPPAYPYDDWLQASLPIAVAVIICVTAQQLVARARHEAAVARRQRAMIEQVGAVVGNLFASSDVRRDLCVAPLRVAGASAAILLEPDATGTRIRLTAEAGVQRSLVDTTLLATGALAGVLAGGRRRLLGPVDPERLGELDLWAAGGCPETVLYRAAAERRP